RHGGAGAPAPTLIAIGPHCGTAGRASDVNTTGATATGGNGGAGGTGGRLFGTGVDGSVRRSAVADTVAGGTATGGSGG
ncbi:hypothetical protein PJI13_29820, partial [Mycobacterium kansasii]